MRTLRFTPYAWAKLIYLRDAGETEIGCFGIAGNPDDPLLITDLETVEQDCTSVTVKFDDNSVADLFDRMVDAGLQPEQFARVWIHTHPDIGAEPSGTDEETFQRVFGTCNWAVMFILAKGGETYCRIRYGIGAESQIKIENEIDYSVPFNGSDQESWEAEYRQNVTSVETARKNGKPKPVETSGYANSRDSYFGADDSDWDGMETIHPIETDRLQNLADKYGMTVEETKEHAIRGVDW